MKYRLHLTATESVYIEGVVDVEAESEEAARLMVPELISDVDWEETDTSFDHESVEIVSVTQEQTHETI